MGSSTDQKSVRMRSLNPSTDFCESLDTIKNLQTLLLFEEALSISQNASMLSRQALHRLRPTLARVATRSLATQASRPKAGSPKAARDDGLFWKAGLLGLLASVGVTTMEAQQQQQQQQQHLTPMERPLMNKEDLNHPPPRPDLPTFALEDVAEHCEDSSLWYTFRGGVYDMTFFLHGHPGGEPVSSVR